MFSIIISVKNESFLIEFTLDSIYNYVDIDLIKDIIIVDDNSEDQNLELVLRDHFLKDKLKIVRIEDRGPSYARNLGAEYATGEYLIFLDAHVYCKGLNLKKIANLLKNDENGIYTGIVYTLDNKKLFSNKLSFSSFLHLRRLPFSDKEIDYTACVGGALMIIKKELFFKLGGFNRFYKVYGYEDLEISLRSWAFGYKCYTTNSINIAHYFRRSMPYHVDYKNYAYNGVFIYLTYIHDIYEKDYLVRDSIIKKIGEEYFYDNVENIKSDPLALSYISWVRSNIKIDLNKYIDENIIWE